MGAIGMLVFTFIRLFAIFITHSYYLESLSALRKVKSVGDAPIIKILSEESTALFYQEKIESIGRIQQIKIYILEKEKWVDELSGKTGRLFFVTFVILSISSFTTHRALLSNSPYPMWATILSLVFILSAFVLPWISKLRRLPILIKLFKYNDALELNEERDAIEFLYERPHWSDRIKYSVMFWNSYFKIYENRISAIKRHRAIARTTRLLIISIEVVLYLAISF